MYDVAICDKNTKERKLMVELIKQSRKGEEIRVYEFDSIEKLANHKVMFHFSIISISVADEDDFQCAVTIRNSNPEQIMVIYSDQLVRTPDIFRIQPYRYFLKNDLTSHKRKVIKESLEELKKREERRYVLLHDKTSALRLAFSKILYVERFRGGSLFHLTSNEEYYTTINLSCIFMQLKQFGFAYAHNSYVVNLHKVVKCERGHVILDDNVHLGISRSKQKDFLLRMKSEIFYPLIM